MDPFQGIHVKIRGLFSGILRGQYGRFTKYLLNTEVLKKGKTALVQGNTTGYLCSRS
jgi:hypothetical protein